MHKASVNYLGVSDTNFCGIDCVSISECSGNYSSFEGAVNEILSQAEVFLKPGEELPGPEYVYDEMYEALGRLIQLVGQENTFTQSMDF